MDTGHDMHVKANKWRGEKLWLSMLIAGMVLGVLAFCYISLFGHTHEFRTPWEPAWGLLVAAFEFFILCGAGLALVSGGVFLVAGERFQGLCMRMISLAGLGFVIGLGLVAVELTQPTRLTMTSVLGPVFYQSLLLDLFWFALTLGALFALVGQLRRKRATAAMALGGGIFVLTFFGIYQMGAVFRQFGHPAEWLSPQSFIAYLFVAVISGTALGTLMLFLSSKFDDSRFANDHAPLLDSLRKWLLASLVLYGVWMVIVFASDAAGLLPLHPPVPPFLLTGPLAFPFWGGQLGVGFLLPLLLLRAGLRPVGVERVALASGLILTGQFFRSYDTVIGTQLGTFHAESPFLVEQGLLAMTPCLPKTLVVVGAICLFLFIMVLREKIVSWEEGAQD